MAWRFEVALGSDANSIVSTCEELNDALSRGVSELAQELGTERNRSCEHTEHG